MKRAALGLFLAGFVAAAGIVGARIELARQPVIVGYRNCSGIVGGRWFVGSCSRWSDGMIALPAGLWGLVP